MHELSIAMNIVEGTEEEAERHPGRIIAVHLRLGVLSGVIEEALVPAFEMARLESSRLREANLIIEVVPGRDLEIVALELDDGEIDDGT